MLVDTTVWVDHLRRGDAPGLTPCAPPRA